MLDDENAFYDRSFRGVSVAAVRALTIKLEN